jgi:hypothetical protein
MRDRSEFCASAFPGPVEAGFSSQFRENQKERLVYPGGNHSAMSLPRMALETALANAGAGLLDALDSN